MTTSINFAAYCNAFTVMGSAGGQSWSQRIYSNLDPITASDGEWSVENLERGAQGDGRVEVPEYTVREGRTITVGTRILTQDGSILRVVDGSEQTIAHVDAEVAQYFIAGAFGMAELTNPLPLDQSIVDGLMTLYQICRRGGSTCEDSETFGTVAARWNAIVSERQALEQARQEATRLQQEYDGLSSQIGGQADLLARVAAYRQAIPQNPQTLDDYQQTARNLQAMIDIAMAQQAEEQLASQTADRQIEIANWRAAMAGMRDRIDEAEGVYYRFTEAYDAGMACMPQPQTPEEEYCVAGNTYRMGIRLEQLAEAHPEHDRCVRSERRRCTPCSTLYNPNRPGCTVGCGSGGHRSHCVEWGRVGHDTSAEEALSIARSYCTTTCR